VNRACCTFGFAVLAPVISEEYPYHGNAVAAPGSASAVTMPSEPLTATLLVPYQTTSIVPGAPPCTQSNSLVADGLVLTRTAADQLLPWSVENA
jgi:hypothetical protein